MAAVVGAGVNRHTGKAVVGWAHVLLCLEVIFTTMFGERVLRRWFGSFLPRLLGENLTPATISNFLTALYAALEWEPRFQVYRIEVLSTADDLRQGRLKLALHGKYRPRAHLGDYTVEGERLVYFNAGSAGNVSVST